MLISLHSFVPFLPFRGRGLGWEQGPLQYLRELVWQQIALGLPQAQDTTAPLQGSLTLWPLHSQSPTPFPSQPVIHLLNNTFWGNFYVQGFIVIKSLNTYKNSIR